MAVEMMFPFLGMICRINRISAVVVLILCTVMAASVQSAPADADSRSEWVVRYPSVDVKTDVAYARRTEYFAKLLRLALDKSGAKSRLVPVSTLPVSASRNSRSLMQSKYDICWMHSSVEREELLVPVRIPLIKGLMGWRIAFVRKDDTARFHNIHQLSDLKKLRAGQGHDWLDTKIMRANGLTVSTSVYRDSLLAMLTHKRIDYFPRSVSEIWDELEMHSDLDIAIDTQFALWYPNVAYFFVTQENRALAKLVERGLENAIMDGSFDIIFNAYFEDFIRQAQLEGRELIVLKHPDVAEQKFPLDRTELWYMPKSLTDYRLLSPELRGATNVINPPSSIH